MAVKGTKASLLQLLAAEEGGWLSGEDAAAALGVSRSAVWKAAGALRESGLEIEAVTGLGYRLAPGSDVLNETAVRAHLENPQTQLRVLEEVDSTNLEAKRWAMEGAENGSMVISRTQTAGRGRMGRTFLSPPGGMYLSVILRPPAEKAADAVLMTTAAAAAGCLAVSHLCKIELGIKWVNDLYYQGKKVCGILTEASTSVETGLIEYMVVGIGINHTTPPQAFAPEVRAVAGSLYPNGKAPVSRARLAAEIHSGIMQAFNELPKRSFLEEYRKRSLVLGEKVTVMANPQYTATAEEIDENAGLVLRLENGKRQTLSYGEISIKAENLAYEQLSLGDM